MKFTQHNLPEYFSIADKFTSWHQEPTNTFNFVNRDSDTLTVTVGDSWTWGSDISENNWDDELRLRCVYGNLVSQKLGTDWLNLGLSATSNFWLTGMVEELARTIPQLEYKKINVICVFTGVGRWFFTQFDRYIDYPKWILENVNEPHDFNKLIVKFNQDCVARIQQALSPFVHVTIRYSTNFVDPIGWEQVPYHQQLQPWYKIMNCDDGLVSHVCMDGVKALFRMPEVVTRQDHLSIFKQWMLTDIIPPSESRNLIFTNTQKFRNYHPLAEGHAQWAEYVAGELSQ
jgi:hypothetical protein